MVWNFFPSKVILILGKGRSCRAPILGCRGAESPGWFDVLSKNSAWAVMQEWTRCRSGHDAGVDVLLWWSCQSPVAHSCGLLNHLNSFRRGIFKLNAKSDVDSLVYSLSHFECDSHNTVHMLTQWCLLPPLTSTVTSSLITPVHSSPLALAARLHRCHSNCSCYINNHGTFSGQTSYNFCNSIM